MRVVCVSLTKTFTQFHQILILFLYVLFGQIKQALYWTTPQARLSRDPRTGITIVQYGTPFPAQVRTPDGTVVNLGTYFRPCDETEAIRIASGQFNTVLPPLDSRVAKTMRDAAALVAKGA